MDDLVKEAQIVEQPFESAVPMLGGLIVRLRTMWNDAASRWYVQKLFQQQTHFNHRVAKLLIVQEERLIAQDRELIALTHTVAELELQIKRLSRSTKDGELLKSDL